MTDRQAFYTPLRVRTDFSLGMGASHPEDMVERAASLGLQACAITDKGLMGGCFLFSKAAVKKHIKPLIGCEILVETVGFTGSLLFIAASEAGYIAINHILQLSFTPREKGKKKFIPDTPALNLTDEIRDILRTRDVIVLTGEGDNGFARQSIRFDGGKALQEVRDLVGADNLYMEICRSGGARHPFEPDLLRYAEDHDLPLVATTDCWYADASRATAYQMLAFANGSRSELVVLDMEKSSQGNLVMRGDAPALHMPDTETFLSWFSDLPDAVDNTNAIAIRASFTVDVRDPVLPPFPCPNGMTEEELLRRNAMSGMRHLINKYNLDENVYLERAQMELDVICRMGFPGYFLIVSEFIQWAKGHNALVGPGRGSGAGSVVAWALRITDVDPIEHGLLFERFLNPERVSMPDFDIDFDPDHREEVLDHVREVYGEDNVCAISAFGGFQTKSSLDLAQRCVSVSARKTLDTASFGEMRNVREIIDDYLLGDAQGSLSKCLETRADLRSLLDDSENPIMRAVYWSAMLVEGLRKNQTTHAAGVVISGQPLYTMFPVIRDRKKHVLMSAYDMKSVESVGAVKYDFLGLTNLSTLQLCSKLVRKSGRTRDITPDETRVNPDVYRSISAGLTEGVFQFSSDSMTGALVKLGPTNFADCAAMTALYRPGPMAYLDSFVHRKHGIEKIDYPLARYAVARMVPDLDLDSVKAHVANMNNPELLAALDNGIDACPKDAMKVILTSLPDCQMRENPLYPAIGNKVEDLLSETYGYMVYQEQVMGIARIAAGYSYGGADILRRAMGKKIREEMARQRDVFVDGCMNNHIARQDAIDLFANIEKFAEYGFNKSHSVAYTIISYQTMWYKVKYPAYFYAALLTHTEREKHARIMHEMSILERPVRIYLQDINISEANPMVVDDGESVRLGLSSIATMNAVAELIVGERGDKPFKSIIDFWRRCRNFVTTRHFSYLVESGALDKLDPYAKPGIRTNRQRLSLLITWMNTKEKKSDRRQTGLFGDESYDPPATYEVMVDAGKKRTSLVVYKSEDVPEWADRGLKEYTQVRYSSAEAYITEHTAELAAIGMTRVDVIEQFRTLSEQYRVEGVCVPLVLTSMSDVTKETKQGRGSSQFRRATSFIGSDGENNYIQVMASDPEVVEVLYAALNEHIPVAVFASYQRYGRDASLFVHSAVPLSVYIRHMTAHDQHAGIGSDYVVLLREDASLQAMNHLASLFASYRSHDLMGRVGSRIIFQTADDNGMPKLISGMPDRDYRLRDGVIPGVFPLTDDPFQCNKNGRISVDTIIATYSLTLEDFVDIINRHYDKMGDEAAIADCEAPILQAARKNAIGSLMPGRYADMPTLALMMLSEATWERTYGKPYSGREEYLNALSE